VKEESMSDKNDPSDALRKRAEEVLAGQGVAEAEADPRMQEIVHELLVHQTELEMQNEELRRAQEEIDRARNRYADLYDFAPLGYFIFDRAGLILEANLTGAALLGVDRASLARQPFSVFVERVSRKTFYAHLNAAQRYGRKGICELTIDRRDGTRIEVRLESAPVTDRDGTVSVRTAMSDITESKKAEGERARLAAAVEQAAEGIYILDPHGVIEYANDAFCAIFGYEREELKDKNIRAMQATTDRLNHESLWSTIRAGERWAGRLAETRKDGTVFHLEATVVPIKDSSGKIVTHVGVCRDITEHLRLEAQLRQSQKLEALGTLTGGIAHDFNNMLAAIIGFTELVVDHVNEGSHDRRHLDRVLQASLRGRELVRQLLAFTRKSEPQRKHVLLSSVIEETEALLRASIPATIEIRVDIKSESGPVLCDPVQIQQVLMNLCTNAADAMRERGGVLEIELSDFAVLTDPDILGLRRGSFMRLSVSDTGHGISPDIADRIFDPFLTTKEVGRGTGLGLSVVHGIVRGCDGAITVESPPGEGATFRVYLPQVREEHAEAIEAAKRVPGGRERILFIDDEEALIEMSEEILTDLGYNVTSRMSSREALALLKEDPNRFDLIITDQTMPGMTGIELARQILAIRADMPIIMCTGFSELVDADKAKAAGIRAFAMKPMTKREIAKTIRKVLDN
jgi:PAS domain S-box-containing protein